MFCFAAWKTEAFCLEDEMLHVWKKLAGTALQDVVAEMLGGKRNQGRSWHCNVSIIFLTEGENQVLIPKILLCSKQE